MPVYIQQYERYLPTAFDESMTLLEKVNKVIHVLYEIGELSNELVDKWNELSEWILGEGLQDAVNKKIDEMRAQGLLDEIIAGLSKYYLKPVDSNVLLGVNAGDGVKGGSRHNLIAIGKDALSSATETTKNCTAIGTGALQNNKSGYYNEAIGFFAMRDTDGDGKGGRGGSRNVAIGSQALCFFKGEEGWANIAIGRNSLQTGEETMHSVSVGVGSMCGFAPLDLDDKTITNSTPLAGDFCTAIGNDVMPLTVGDYNVGMGYQAGRALKNGFRNTMIGFQSGYRLEENISYWGNKWLLGSLQGNYITENNLIKMDAPNDQFKVGDRLACDFISVQPPLHYVINVVKTDSQHIYFDIPDQAPASGVIKLSRFVGSGQYIWRDKSVSIATNTDDISVGNYVLMKLGAHEQNYYEVTDVQDGMFWVKTNIVAPNNGESGIAVILGVDTSVKMDANTDNTLLGVKSGWNMTKGNFNTGVGGVSLGNNLGNNNTALGYNSLAENTVGSRNTAVGYGAGRFKAGGEPQTDFNNTTAIGYNARVSGSNQLQLGDGSTIPYAYQSLQLRSDARDKADIRDTILGLDFINSIRPVDYRLDLREDYIIVGENDEIQYLPKDGSKKRVRFHHGVLAQEVQEAAEKLGVEFGGLQHHAVNGGEDIFSVGYEEFISPLIKSIQELTQRVKTLEEKLQGN